MHACACIYLIALSLAHVWLQQGQQQKRCRFYSCVWRGFNISLDTLCNNKGGRLLLVLNIAASPLLIRTNIWFCIFLSTDVILQNNAPILRIDNIFNPQHFYNFLSNFLLGYHCCFWIRYLDIVCKLSSYTTIKSNVWKIKQRSQPALCLDNFCFFLHGV